MDGKTVHDQSNLQLRARQFGGDWLIRKEHRRWLMLAFGVFGVIDVELSALNAAPVRNALADAAWIGFAGRVIRAQIDEGPSLQRTVRRDARDGTSGSGYVQAALAKLIHCLRARLSFILGIYGDLGRQTAELIADVPAALAAI